MSDFKFEKSKELIQEIKELEEKIDALEKSSPDSNELSELKLLFAQKKNELVLIYTGCEGKYKSI